MTTTPLTPGEIQSAVTEAIAPYGLTIDEFLEAGERDELDDITLRDLWLMTKNVIREPSAA